MTDLFKKYYGITQTYYIDLSASADPYDQLEYTLKGLVQNILFPSYDRKKHVLLVFYFTGIGFADEQMRSQILLNMPIAQHSDAKKSFQNPYPIEEKLE